MMSDEQGSQNILKSTHRIYQYLANFGMVTGK